MPETITINEFALEHSLSRPAIARKIRRAKIKPLFVTRKKAGHPLGHYRPSDLTPLLVDRRYRPRPRNTPPPE